MSGSICRDITRHAYEDMLALHLIRLTNGLLVDAARI